MELKYLWFILSFLGVLALIIYCLTGNFKKRLYHIGLVIGFTYLLFRFVFAPIFEWCEDKVLAGVTNSYTLIEDEYKKEYLNADGSPLTLLQSAFVNHVMMWSTFALCVAIALVLSRIIMKEKYKEENMNEEKDYVDLGLPSGVLWAKSDSDGESDSQLTLPTYAMAEELIEHCDFTVAFDTEGKTCYVVKGPNGNKIFFRSAPNEETGMTCPSACYWCEDIPTSPDYAYFMLISEETITIGIGDKASHFGYRTVKIM